MMKIGLFEGKYRIKSTRLENWDYSAEGLYYVTICTQNKEIYFGNIENGGMNLSKIGETARKYWNDIPGHFSCIELDEFIVMPNHIHGIIVINGDKEKRRDEALPRLYRGGVHGCQCDGCAGNEIYIRRLWDGEDKIKRRCICRKRFYLLKMKRILACFYRYVWRRMDISS